MSQVPTADAALIDSLLPPEKRQATPPVTTPPTPPADPEDKSGRRDGKVVIKVNGKDVEVTQDELVTMASKAAGADAAFQEAATARRVAEAVKGLADHENGKPVEESVLRGYYKTLWNYQGVPDEDQIALLAEVFGKTGAPAVTDPTKMTPEEAGSEVARKLAELEQRIAEHDKDREDIYKETLTNSVISALKTSKEVDTLIKDDDEEVRKARASEIQDYIVRFAKDLMRQRKARGETFEIGWIPDAVARAVDPAVKKVRSLIGAPPGIGRAPETGTGVRAFGVNIPKPKPLGKAPSESDFKDFVVGSLLSSD